MTFNEFVGLSPVITLGVLVMLQMIAIAVKRHHLFMMLMTVAGLLATLAALQYSTQVLPLDITPLLHANNLSVLFTMLFIFIAVCTCFFSYHYLHDRHGDLEEFYILLVTAVLGATTMAHAVHFASMLLGLEILAISLYTLIAYPEEHHAPLEAALKYLVLSGVASTTAIFGMALVYLAVGEMSFAAIGTAMTGVNAPGFYLIAGNSMLLVGLVFKLSLIPFHMWTPDVYEGAPAPVTGLVASLSKAAVIAVLLNYFVATDILSNSSIFRLLSFLAAGSMVIGNLLALLQDNIKRLLAYSSIAHIGYLLIALLALYQSTNMLLAVEASVVYITGYVFMTLAAFGVITALSRGSTSERHEEVQSIKEYEGLFWRKPLLATVLSISFFSLAGIPLTIGFVAKFYVLAAGIEAQLWMLLWALIIGSSIGIYYYLRIIYAMTLHPDQMSTLSTSADAKGFAQSTPAIVTVVVVALLVLVYGVFPMPLINLVQSALAGM